MAAKNRYIPRAKLSEQQFRQLVSLFALDLEASRIASSLGVSRNTVNGYLRRIRLVIAEASFAAAPEVESFSCGGAFFMVGEAKGGSRYFHKGSKLFFGVLRADNTMRAEIFPEAASRVTRALLRMELYIEGQVYEQGETDGGWRSFERRLRDAERAVSFDACLQRRRRPEESIAEYMQYSSNRLEKFRGVREDVILLHMKECEFRFNHRGQNLYTVLMRLLDGCTEGNGCSYRSDEQ